MSHPIIPEARRRVSTAFAALTLLGGSALGGEDPLRFWRPERRAKQQTLEARLLDTASAPRLRAGHDLVVSRNNPGLLLLSLVLTDGLGAPLP